MPDANQNENTRSSEENHLLLPDAILDAGIRQAELDYAQRLEILTVGVEVAEIARLAIRQSEIIDRNHDGLHRFVELCETGAIDLRAAVSIEADTLRGILNLFPRQRREPLGEPLFDPGPYRV